jgi:hypothetical protein
MAIIPKADPKSILGAPLFGKWKGDIIDPVEWPSTRLNREGQEGVEDTQNNRPNTTPRSFSCISAGRGFPVRVAVFSQRRPAAEVAALE